MKILALVLLVAAIPLSAATVRNDDSCDIGLFPAATLLLPYFEVDINEGTGETTVVTITNVSAVPQAARITLWTDFAYPILSFNLYLTGYDVQSINLFDVIKHGVLGGSAPAHGELSRDDNPRLSEDTCASLPSQLPQPFLTRMQNAFTTGKAPSAGPQRTCNTTGGVHTNAVGYATIDVVGACTSSLPVDRHYFPHEIRFDNVLAGDYVQVDAEEGFAQANPLVHIRAIPEGGEASTRRKTNLRRTFYSNLHGTTLDARQPLPATFAARWIQGGNLGFETFYKIWRETETSATTACSAYSAANADTYEVILFDDEENPEVIHQDFLTPFIHVPRLPAVSRHRTLDQEYFPPSTGSGVSGWMYLNLDNRSSPGVASQNWVTVSMEAEARFSADFDAVALGNGCTPVIPLTEKNRLAPAGAPPIGPAPNVNP